MKDPSDTDRYSVETRQLVDKYLREQQLANKGLNKNNINTILMCIMLQKEPKQLTIVQNRRHIQQLRNLLIMLQKVDASVALVPVDDNAGNQDHLREIPSDASSIWRKDLQPYICCKNCHFGNQKTQSLRLRIFTASSVDNYSVGKWIQESWASQNNAGVFHDRIQEGIQVQAACITNIADTTNYRDLASDLQKTC